MKKFLLLIGVIIITGHAYAQFQKAMPASMKNAGHLYGKIIDGDGKPVEGASVLVLHENMDTASKKMKMILVKGMTTKSNGDFDFAQIPIMGKLQLRISSSGYTSLQQEISFMSKSPTAGSPSGAPSFDKDLGNIKLETDTKTLTTVTITGAAPALKLDIDKKVFNVEKNIVSAGGTALDVMRNVP